MSADNPDATSPETVESDEQAAQAPHDADRIPTAEEEAAAEKAGGVDAGVAEAYEESMERGANVKGEGEI